MKIKKKSNFETDNFALKTLEQLRHDMQHGTVQFEFDEPKEDLVDYVKKYMWHCHIALNEAISAIQKKRFGRKTYIPGLFHFSKDELCEIYHNLNCDKWDERLGVAPRKWAKSTEPIMEAIEARVGMKQILKHHNMNNLGKTEEEFEEWYEIALSNAIFGIKRKRT